MLDAVPPQPRCPKRQSAMIANDFFGNPKRLESIDSRVAAAACSACLPSRHVLPAARVLLDGLSFSERHNCRAGSTLEARTVGSRQKREELEHGFHMSMAVCCAQATAPPSQLKRIASFFFNTTRRSNRVSCPSIANFRPAIRRLGRDRWFVLFRVDI